METQEEGREDDVQRAREEAEIPQVPKPHDGTKGRVVLTALGAPKELGLGKPSLSTAEHTV